MLSILCVTLTINVKVGLPESFKVGWYPPKKTGSSHLKPYIKQLHNTNTQKSGQIWPLVGFYWKAKNCSLTEFVTKTFKCVGTKSSKHL